MIREKWPIRPGTRVVSHTFNSGLGTVEAIAKEPDACFAYVTWDNGAIGSNIPVHELTGLEEA